MLTNQVPLAFGTLRSAILISSTSARSQQHQSGRRSFLTSGPIRASREREVKDCPFLLVGYTNPMFFRTSIRRGLSPLRLPPAECRR